MTSDQAFVVVCVLLWMFLISIGVCEGIASLYRIFTEWRSRRFTDRLFTCPNFIVMPVTLKQIETRLRTISRKIPARKPRAKR